MTQVTSWQFYVVPKTAWDGMYEACEQASRTIDLEQYIFEDDAVGRRFLTILARKAQEGVRVRVLVDAVGSRSLAGSKTLTVAKQAGAQVAFFNPIQPWWIHKLLDRFLRTHRKLLIIDQQYCFTGGVGLREKTADRRDTHVRLHGPIAVQMQTAFDRMWEMTGVNKIMFRFAAPVTLSEGFTLLTNSPHYQQRFTYWTLVRKIREAKKYIYLTTPYFVPDARISRALRGAARRGVDVRLIVPKKSDHVVTDLASRSYFWLVLRAGVRIFEYQPSFIHAKTFVIDDAWASVGSSNLDTLSLLFNYEADVASTHPQFVDEVKSQFISDTSHAIEIFRREWKKRSWWRKIGEISTWPFHRLL